MKLVVGSFEFDGRIGLHGWDIYARVPFVGELHTTSHRPGPAASYYHRENGSFDMQAGSAFLVFETAAEIRRWQAVRRVLAA